MGTRSNRRDNAVLTSTHDQCFEQIYRFFFYISIVFPILQLKKFICVLNGQFFVINNYEPWIPASCVLIVQNNNMKCRVCPTHLDSYVYTSQEPLDIAKRIQINSEAVVETILKEYTFVYVTFMCSCKSFVKKFMLLNENQD